MSSNRPHMIAIFIDAPKIYRCVLTDALLWIYYGHVKTQRSVRSGLTGTTTNFKDRQVLHWHHLPFPLCTFRDVHIPNHANIRVMDFHRLAGVFGPLHILLMHHDFLNKQPQ